MADLARRANEPWMNQDCLSGYGSVFPIEDALERAKTADREALMDAILATDTTEAPVDCFLGARLVFEKTGRNPSNAPVLFQWQGGRPQTAFPLADAYAALVSPKAS
jgi:branched-chain amino acid transport system substrate-binding protein